MNYKKFLGAASTALMIVIVIALVLAPGAWAQSKFKTLYKFKGGADGSDPIAKLIFDPAGNLYGTTNGGGNLTYCLDGAGCGTVFKLTPNADGSWTESVLYTFCSLANCADGAGPEAGLIFDQAGNLYGTTWVGGDSSCNSGFGCGTVFKLAPNSDASWTESVLYSFTGGSDGEYLTAGLAFDPAGNLYGTTVGGGAYNGGVVFRLAPNLDGSWTENVLHTFCSLANCSDGGAPHAELILDRAGNLYGTTYFGGAFGGGTVFELTPNGDGSWTEKVLRSFCRYGCGRGGAGLPYGGLIFDQAGNLYGTTLSGGAYGYGVAFKLAPRSNGGWNEVLLYQFTGGKDGGSPYAGLSFDQAGHLYGTTESGGYNGKGVVFKLAHSKGGWNETVLHHFIDHPGTQPWAGLIVDAAGNLYGAARGDYTRTFVGTVFEISP